jgi:uncharacterized membrane protein YdjX (TVP38/TMEM64 family)
VASRTVILCLVATAAAAFLLAGGQEHLDFEQLKAAERSLEALYETRPLETIVVFFVFYVAISATSLPGGAVLTLGAGAIFGVALGTLLVSFASTLGATLAFLASRYLFASWVRRRLGSALATLDHGIERDGARYLFLARLVPVIPFFVVNFGMGLTRMRTFTYYWVSQASMLAGTLPFAHAGERLAEMRSPADVLSPGVLSALLMLGLLPFAAKKIAEALSSRGAPVGHK